MFNPLFHDELWALIAQLKMDMLTDQVMHWRHGYKAVLRSFV